MKTKTRLARDGERSILLKLKGYTVKCVGKCAVKSVCHSDKEIYVIKDIEHKCKQ